MGPFDLLQTKRVIVTLKDDQETSVEGIFWRKRGTVLWLKQAILHRPGMDPVPLDGEFVVERPNVSFIQVL